MVGKRGAIRFNPRTLQPRDTSTNYGSTKNTHNRNDTQLQNGLKCFGQILYLSKSG